MPDDPDINVVADRLSYMFYGGAGLMTLLFILVIICKCTYHHTSEYVHPKYTEMYTFCVKDFSFVEHFIDECNWNLDSVTKTLMQMFVKFLNTTNMHIDTFCIAVLDSFQSKNMHYDWLMAISIYICMRPYPLTFPCFSLHKGSPNTSQ